MSKTKSTNKKSKKRAKRIAEAAARSNTVSTNLSPGLPAGGLAQFLKDNGITEVAPWQEDDVSAVSRLQEGIAQAEAGDLVDLGSFAQHVDLDSDAERADAFLREHVQVIPVTLSPAEEKAAQAEPDTVASDDVHAAITQLTGMGIVALRQLSKGKGISGAYAMKKPQLIQALIDAGVTPPA